MAELRVKSTGTIKLFENDNTSSVTIASPASLGADRTVTLPDASVTLASGTMLATDGSGASLTALNASELGSGTVPTARLGSGTASSSTVLYGDQTYKTEPSGGLVLQVINKIDDTYQATASSTFADTSLSQAITPSATSSKILIIVEQKVVKASGNTGVKLNLMRDTTELEQFQTIGGETETSTRNDFGTSAFFYLDSPSSTSELVYKTQIANYVNSTGAARTNNSGSDKSSMVLMEISG